MNSKSRNKSSENYQFPSLPQSFITKKSNILAAITIPEEDYTDKSPKGSIDTPIIDLIRELNEIEGIVTTSSCSGRVAVFVEGPRPTPPTQPSSESNEGDEASDTETKAITGSPAGKGGGHWLYVSHEPVPIPLPTPDGFFTQLCGLARPPSKEHNLHAHGHGLTPRLIKLSFSPLILHVLCATLHHAKPLLTAAINAGFRESGLQSLKALDDPEAGSIVGIRTMGLGFETVVGVVREAGGEEEVVYEAVVDEAYLAAMFRVVNERFVWNERRKERLRAEVRRCFGVGRLQGVGRWEDREARRLRKREEGVRRQKALEDIKDSAMEAGEDGSGMVVEDLNEVENNMSDIFNDYR